MCCKKSISDDEIVSLYTKGWSINDIVGKHQLSVVRARRVLQQNKFDTVGYRKISPDLRFNILRCVGIGLSYRETALLLDVSPYLVRQVVNDCTAKITIQKPTPEPMSNKLKKRILDEFISAQYGFSIIIQKLNLSDKEIYSFFCLLTNELISAHQRNLSKVILNLHNSGLPVVAIAKTLGISASVVKKYLK